MESWPDAHRNLVVVALPIRVAVARCRVRPGSTSVDLDGEVGEIADGSSVSGGASPAGEGVGEEPVDLGKPCGSGV
ncbi:MAG: hypothetical protein ACR2GE_14240, partial [Pseudonocardia sp.]